MYLEACLQQHRHFSPFIASVDGLLGVEATATLKRLASRLATKWKQSYSKTCGYVKSRIVITLVRGTHRSIQGSRVPEHRISVQLPQWEDGAGLDLFELARQGSLYPPSPLSHPNPRNIKEHHHRPSQSMQADEIKWSNCGKEGGTGYTCPPSRKTHQ